MDAEDLEHNVTINALLGDRGLACLGPVVVVKHPADVPAPVDAPVSNIDLPILDIEPAEIPLVDEMVVRYVPAFIFANLNGG